MVKYLPKALLLALLVGAPVMGKPVTWDFARDFFLGRGRSDLMEECAEGRKINQIGAYYFDTRLQDKRKERMLSKLLPKDASIEIEIDAMLAGRAAAMAVACPNVW